MGEFDDSVRVALRERAEGVVHVEDLLAGARRRGLRRRRVRQTLLGVGTASVLAVVMLLSSLGLVPGWEPAENADGAWLPRPPEAGRHETNVLRLDVTDPDAHRLMWVTDGNKQRLDVQRAPHSLGIVQYVVTLAQSESDLDAMYPDYPDDGLRSVSDERVTISGNTGKLTTDEERWAWVRWWRPDGRWLGVSIVFDPTAAARPIDYREAALQVALWVRDSVAYRCVVDFRLDWVPQGSRPIGCMLGIAPEYRRYGLLIETADRATFTAATELASNRDRVDANTSVGGRSVEMANNSARYLYGGRVFEVGTTPSLSSDELLKVVEGFVALPDPLAVR